MLYLEIALRQFAAVPANVFQDAFASVRLHPIRFSIDQTARHLNKGITRLNKCMRIFDAMEACFAF